MVCGFNQSRNINTKNKLQSHEELFTEGKRKISKNVARAGLQFRTGHRSIGSGVVH